MSKNNNTLNTLSTLSVFSSFTKKLISENHYAKIHSIFDNGFNLSIGDLLIYISPHQEGMLSSTGLSIDQTVFDRLVSHMKPGAHVRLRENQLMFYTTPHILTVNLIIDSVKELIVIPMTEKELLQSQLKERLDKINILEKSGFYGNKNLMHLLLDIKNTKKITSKQIKSLIGAGVGLTPSGDDFLQGAILMEQTLNHLPHIQAIVEKKLAERSTTAISVSYYLALFKGYSNEPLVLLFNALKEQEETTYKKAITSLENYGSTSGYDLLLGMSTYLQIIEDRKV